MIDDMFVLDLMTAVESSHSYDGLDWSRSRMSTAAHARRETHLLRMRETRERDVHAAA